MSTAVITWFVGHCVRFRRHRPEDAVPKGLTVYWKTVTPLSVQDQPVDLLVSGSALAPFRPSDQPKMSRIQMIHIIKHLFYSIVFFLCKL